MPHPVGPEGRGSDTRGGIFVITGTAGELPGVTGIRLFRIPGKHVESAASALITQTPEEFQVRLQTVQGLPVFHRHHQLEPGGGNALCRYFRTDSKAFRRNAERLEQIISCRHIRPEFRQELLHHHQRSPVILLPVHMHRARSRPDHRGVSFEKPFLQHDCYRADSIMGADGKFVIRDKIAETHVAVLLHAAALLYAAVPWPRLQDKDSLLAKLCCRLLHLFRCH